jgi:hypothetical protein
MVYGSDVLSMLIPQGGWIISGDDYSGITWVDNKVKISQEEFEAGFVAYDTWKAEKDAQVIAAKTAAQAKLAALGLTTDDLKALGL